MSAAAGALSADDVREIEALYHRYARAADEGDGDAYAACFTAGGVIETVTGRSIQGRDKLAEYAREVRAGAAERGVQLRMWVGNLLCEASGEGAIGSAYVIAFEIAPGSSPKTIFSGTYADELAREDGRWLLAVRRASADG